MKEFEKKGNPNREPPSEGMKGLSKFLPMTDSNYRRRLTEYEVQVQDLQTYVRSLETETGRLRKKIEDMPKEFMILVEIRGDPDVSMRILTRQFNNSVCRFPENVRSRMPQIFGSAYGVPSGWWWT